MRVTAQEILEMLIAERNEDQRRILMRFFKTGPGEYGEGDEFLGLKVPQTRAIVREAKGQVPLCEIDLLLASGWHEARLCGLLLLVEEMRAALPKRSCRDDKKEIRRKEIVEFYLSHARRANNWDLVDLSAPYILGTYLRLAEDPDYSIIDRLCQSDNLWEQRIAVVSTLDLIRHGIFDHTLRMVDRLMDHKHDLIHKATGWMLREIGKKDKDIMLEYLESRYQRLPRTTLRYAIEKLPEAERIYWLHRR